MSIAQIHRESVSSLMVELNKIGFNLQGLSGVSDLENVLYPHYIGHPVGIGEPDQLALNYHALTSAM